MKCAEAKTRLSFVTATLNSLRAGIAPSPCRAPAALHQRDEDRGGGEVRRGARILGVAPVAELGVEGLERLAPGGAAHPAGLRHILRPPRDRGGRLRPELTRNVRVGAGGEEGEERLHDRVAPGQAVRE